MNPQNLNVHDRNHPICCAGGPRSAGKALPRGAEVRLSGSSRLLGVKNRRLGSRTLRHFA
jgi:hypothetical protein